MLVEQKSMLLSNFIEIYEAVIPTDNMLRKIKELVNFDFVYEELRTEYCLDNGRNAIDPIIMFKYLLLKIIYDISDLDVVERSRYDMSFKYFLDMTPEQDVIDSSSLTKFRKLRLKNTNLLDLLVNKTVEIAIEKGIIKSKSIIVDSTHTRSRYNQKSPCEILSEASKNLRKSVYKIDEAMKTQFPLKIDNGNLEDQMEYCKELIEVVKGNDVLSAYPVIISKINTINELLEDDVINLISANDTDAKIGHKTSDTSFFGYKTHLAMTEERIITAAIITSGEKSDGKQLKSLIEKSKKTGMKIDNVIGDKAYSEKENIEYACSDNLKLISKLNSSITQGLRKKEDEFAFNKDAGMYVCKAGHMAYRKIVDNIDEKRNRRITYDFNINKCRVCPIRKGCYREGATRKTYSETIKSHIHIEQEMFQESNFFKSKVKERYKIEAKNSELKHRHGYDIASSSGLVGMELQGAITIFAVNLKRILKLMDK
jgi:transposase